MKETFLIIALLLLFASTNNLNAQPEIFLKNRILVKRAHIRNPGNISEVWESATGGYSGYGIPFPDQKLLILRTGYLSNSLKRGVNFEDKSS